MNKKILLITLISLTAPVLVADDDLFDRISLAIKSSDVVQTKSLVRQLDDRGLTPKEKNKALNENYDTTAYLKYWKEELTIKINQKYPWIEKYWDEHPLPEWRSAYFAAAAKKLRENQS